MIGATQAYSARKLAEGLPFPQAIGKLVQEASLPHLQELPKNWGKRI